VPGVEITSDFIVGFPGETDEEFQATEALVERVGFLQAYVFKYSVRPRTLAARRLPDDVPEEVKKRRNQALLDAQDRTAARRQSALVGTRVEILVEGPSKTDPARVTGRDRYNRLVHAAGDGRALAGRLVSVDVSESSAHCLIGSVVAGPTR
jgi:tRNA-2-methylthio-N6-dimethylallyladenosine synthase